MILPYKLLKAFHLFVLITCIAVHAKQPFKIRCNKHGVDFLKRHVNPHFFQDKFKGKRFGLAGQLYQWRYYDLTESEEQHTVTELDPDHVMVRVLLAEQRHPSTWQLHSEDGFILSVHTGKESNVVSLKNKKLTVKKFGPHYFINKKLYRKVHQVALRSKGSGIAFEDNVYEGTFFIQVHQDSLLLINAINLEKYVYGVLQSESWPGWPLEVNKAFAIASRSYAIAKVLEMMNAKRKKPFHFKNTNIHQTYRGTHANTILQDAVDQTKGIILAYNKKPVLAMFDSCCGGIIPAHLSDVNFNHAPYLARTVACTFCKPCKIYQWALELPLNDFKQLLSDGGYQIRSLDEVVVSAKDDAGSVKKITINDRHKTHTITGKEFYSLIKKVKSFCYDIERRLKTVYIKGKGYGHHLGICQWGARKMVDCGYSFKNILSFYYPKTHFMRLSPASTKRV